MDLFTAVTQLSLRAGDAAPVLLDSAVKGTVVLALTWGITIAMRRGAASLRHLVWSLGLAGVLVVPLLAVFLPQWNLPSWSRVLNPPTASVETGPLPSPPPPADLVEAAAANTFAAPASQQVAPSQVAGGDAVLSQPVAVSGTATQPLSTETVPFWASIAWSAWLLALWGLGTLATVSIVAWGMWRARRLAAHARPVSDRRVRRFAERLTQALGLRRPARLLQSTGNCMPMTWGMIQPVVLLPSDARSWSETRLRAVLTHELAHVKRHDYAIHLGARVACAVYWFNPLVWLAVRRLRVERELACDDLVLAAGARASDYAGHLLDIARAFRAAPVASLATVAMARPSQLSGRLLAVLDATRARASVTPRLVASASVVALLVVFPLAGANAWRDSGTDAAIEKPAATDASVAVPNRLDIGALAMPSADLPVTRPSETVPQPHRLTARPVVHSQQDCDWDRELRSGRTSSSYNVGDDDVSIRIRAGDCRLEIDMRGEVVFSNDDHELVSISRGGYFEIEEREGRSEIRLEIRPARDGTLEYRWRVDGTVQPYNARGEAWLAQMLPVLFRRTGVNAEQRANRILTQGGVDALLQEISLIQSDHVARKYFEVLLTKGTLDVATVQRVVRMAGQRINSDHELGQLLIKIATTQPVDESVQAAYVEAAGTISSDHQHRQVLSAILKRPGLSQDVADAMLRSAKEISSDHEMGTLLREFVETHEVTVALTPAFFDAVNSIDSDHEQRRVLAAVLSRGAPSQDVLDRSLESAVRISSDHELGQLLRQVAELYPVHQTMPASYLAAANTISSGHERARVLSSLLARDDLASGAMAAVLGAAQRISSDHNLSQVLRAVVEKHALDDVTRPAFFRAVGEVSSDFEHARILTVVIQKDPLMPETAAAVLESALGIQSDHELGKLLILITERVTIDDQLRPAFMRATDSIGSQHERGRVLSALYPRGRPTNR